MKKITLAVLLLIITAGPLQATTRTVKAAGGGDFTTIQACSNASVAGDTCTVFAGSYSGWTPSASGSSGFPITYNVNTGDTVTVTSGVPATNRSYITIQGFNFASSAHITGDSTTNHWTIDHNTFAGTNVFRIPDGAGSTGSDNVFSNNVVNVGQVTSTGAAVYVFGDRNRFENNDISNGGVDCYEIGGAFLVIRGEFCHNENGSTSGEHIDFVQGIGGAAPVISFSLIENNKVQGNVNQAHCAIYRTLSSGVGDTNIFRFNFCQNIDSGPGWGGSGDNVPNGWMYNNTIATEHFTANENGDCGSWQNAANGQSLNNIFYKCVTAGSSPVVGNAFGNGDIAFTPGYNGAWNSPYSSEPTYNTLRNHDPLFANYPTDGTLQAGSPAIGAGVALTTAVGAGSSSTLLTVVNSHGFQPGWAGVQADWIRIGASTTVQISSINYSTNVITLASPVSWNNSDHVYLYKNSSGTVVLNGANPDIGAFPFSSGNPVVSLSSSAVNFFNQLLLTTSSIQQVILLTNTGNSTLTISGTVFGGTNAGDFTAGAATTCGASLGVGNSCQYAFTFTPSVLGPRSATFSIIDNASGSPHVITLAGTGVNPVSGLGSITGTGIIKINP